LRTAAADSCGELRGRLLKKAGMMPGIVNNMTPGDLMVRYG